MIWHRLNNGNWMGYSGKYYAFIKVTKHYVREGFEKYIQWWTAYIGIGGEWIKAEGIFGSYLSTIKKAKRWVSENISQYEADSFRMRIDTARKQEKLRKQSIKKLKPHDTRRSFKTNSKVPG